MNPTLEELAFSVVSALQNYRNKRAWDSYPQGLNLRGVLLCLGSLLFAKASTPQRDHLYI